MAAHLLTFNVIVLLCKPWIQITIPFYSHIPKCQIRVYVILLKVYHVSFLKYNRDRKGLSRTSYRCWIFRKSWRAKKIGACTHKNFLTTGPTQANVLFITYCDTMKCQTVHNYNLAPNICNISYSSHIRLWAWRPRA